jgi:hypothetical protein
VVAYTSVRDEPTSTSTRIYTYYPSTNPSPPFSCSAHTDVIDIPEAIVTVAAACGRYVALTAIGEVWEWGATWDSVLSGGVLGGEPPLKTPTKRTWKVERPLGALGRLLVVDVVPDDRTGRFLALVALLTDCEDDVSPPFTWTHKVWESLKGL